MKENGTPDGSSTWDQVSGKAKRYFEKGEAKWKEGLWEIEKDDSKTDETKVDQVIIMGATACAAIAIQPIPFADIIILTPLQVFFATKIAAIRNVPISKEESYEVIKQFMGVVGLGMLAQQFAIGVWKVGTFGIGSFLTIPLVFSLTYALLRLCDLYYINRAKGVTLTNKELKKYFKKMKREGKSKFKENKDQIHSEENQIIDEV
jgi:uncharacterized protein (DUF697 family)